MFRDAAVVFRGTEGEVAKGLNLIPGTVRKINTDYILPHVGWNQLKISDMHPAFKSFEQTFVYFVHTYQAETDDRYIVAKSNYGEAITAIVRSGIFSASNSTQRKAPT